RKLFEQNYERSHLTTKAITFGSKRNQSLHISLESGLFKDFKTGVGGNIYGLIHYGLNDIALEKNNKEGFKESLDWAKNYLGNLDPAYKYEHQKNIQNFSNRHQKIETKSLNTTPIFEDQKTKNDTLKCISPITQDLQNLDLKTQKNLTKVLSGFEVKEVYPYTNEKGELFGITARLVDENGAKKVLPFSYWVDSKTGKEFWRMKRFEGTPPLYNLKELADKKEAPVLIVEGEKTANAAREIFKDHVVVTWIGGCNGYKNTDFSPLKDRDITIWPDNDKAGEKAAFGIKEHLKNEHKTDLKIVDLPASFDHKWDLADPLPKGFENKDLHTLLNVHLPEKMENITTFRGIYKGITKTVIKDRFEQSNYQKLLGDPKEGFCGLVEHCSASYLLLTKGLKSNEFNHEKILDLSIYTALVLQRSESMNRDFTMKNVLEIVKSFDLLEKNKADYLAQGHPVLFQDAQEKVREIIRTPESKEDPFKDLFRLFEKNVSYESRSKMANHLSEKFEHSIKSTFSKVRSDFSTQNETKKLEFPELLQRQMQTQRQMENQKTL
ncbi:MAG TPA: DUF6371 domain-containing protein, partial [Alphaproteobacteria bacterium]|nr:DUF6371 domain-containing protein [Alphaproteobacteria bacterium]